MKHNLLHCLTPNSKQYMANLMFKEIPPSVVLLKLLDQLFFWNIFKNLILRWQGNEKIPQKSEIMRKHQSKGISEYAGAGICLRPRLQWTIGVGHRRQSQTPGRGPIIAQSRKKMLQSCWGRGWLERDMPISSLAEWKAKIPKKVFPEYP